MQDMIIIYSHYFHDDIIHGFDLTEIHAKHREDFVPIARIQKGFTGVVAFEQRSLFSG